MRKLGSVAAGAVLLTFFVTGCGGSGGGSEASSTRSSTGSSGGSSEASFLTEGANAGKECSGTPRRGGSLVYDHQAETVTLDPYKVLSGGDIFTQEMMYTGLVRNDPNGEAKIVPALAKSWEVSPNGKSYTFHLRAAKFSNGAPVTAEDVKYSLENFGNPKVNSLLAVLATGYKNTEVVNSSTVRVNLKEPVAAFLYDISVFPAFILPKQLVEREGEAFWKHPVGAGPFKLKEFAQGSHVTLVRNPYYWEEGKPYLETLRFNFATESNSRMLDLKDGQAQIVDGVPYAEIESLHNAGLIVQRTPAEGWYAMSVNTKRPYFAELDVRKAMEYALNRGQVNSQILKGVGAIPNSIFGHFQMDASASTVKPYEYSLAKAKEYMAKSKFPKGFSTTLQYPAGFEYYKQMALLIQQDYAEIGIKVKLSELSQASNTERFFHGEYEMSLPYAIYTSDIAAPDEFAGYYGLPNETEGYFSYWSDPHITELVKRFLTTTNEASRETQWPVIQREFLEQSPTINVIDTPVIHAHRKGVCGTYVNALESDQLQLTWLAGPSS